MPKTTKRGIAAARSSKKVVKKARKTTVKKSNITKVPERKRSVGHGLPPLKQLIKQAATLQPTMEAQVSPAPAVRPKTILVVRGANKDLVSSHGFQYPALGPVEAPDWNGRAECGGGLHGLAWGVGDWGLLPLGDPNSRYQVIEVEDTPENLVSIDGGDKVKFHRGIVKYTGSLAGILHELESGGCPWVSPHKDALALAALDSAGTGNRSPAATTGYASPAATTGNRSPAATTGEASPAATMGYASPAATTGEASPAATTGNRSPAATMGEASPAATTGKYSIAAAIGLGGPSRARSGEKGAVILTHYVASEDRYRVVVGYVGEGILADTWYTLDTTGRLVVSTDQSEPIAACAPQKVVATA